MYIKRSFTFVPKYQKQKVHRSLKIPLLELDTKRLPLPPLVLHLHLLSYPAREMGHIRVDTRQFWQGTTIPIRHHSNQFSILHQTPTRVALARVLAPIFVARADAVLQDLVEGNFGVIFRALGPVHQGHLHGHEFGAQSTSSASNPITYGGALFAVHVDLLGDGDGFGRLVKGEGRVDLEDGDVVDETGRVLGEVLVEDHVHDSVVGTTSDAVDGPGADVALGDVAGAVRGGDDEVFGDDATAADVLADSGGKAHVEGEVGDFGGRTAHDAAFEGNGWGVR